MHIRKLAQFRSRHISESYIRGKKLNIILVKASREHLRKSYPKFATKIVTVGQSFSWYFNDKK